MFESFCISLSNTLENIRKVISLEYAVKRLKRLYARDTFSGIYNRNGFVLATAEVYEDCVANVLVKSCTNGEIYCRFGGDEFIVFAADATEEEASALTKLIADNIAELNASGVNPFTLSASTGYVITKPQEGEDIFNFVTEADKVMYAEKKKKKLSKYLKA